MADQDLEPVVGRDSDGLYQGVVHGTAEGVEPIGVGS
jgi:hypothetical protein